MTLPTKTCRGCFADKSVDDFYPAKHGKLGRRSKCKLCIVAQNIAWLSRNKAAFKAYRREHYVQNKRLARSQQLQRSFGITVEVYDEALRSQGSLCALCRKPEVVRDKSGTLRSLSVDHDHASGRIRGLLCFACNTSLGTLERNGLEGLSRYLAQKNIEVGVPTSHSCLLGRRACRALVRKFGISCDAYSRLLAAQSSACAICFQTGSSCGRRLAVDHDHRTGAVRGLLCSPCNLALGRFDQSAHGFSALLAYVSSSDDVRA